MTNEQQLQKIILDKFKSVAEFSRVCGVPYMTIKSILDKDGGLQKTGTANVIKIFQTLDLDVESVQRDSLSFKTPVIPDEAIPYHQGEMIPVVGTIPAGIPSIATCDIEGYVSADVSNPQEYYWLRVNGDSMINAGIQTGDMVLIHVQPCADNGQIVACRVNGDESTLKRFKQVGNKIFLIPENPSYTPYSFTVSDFDNGYASILGVVVELRRKC